MSTPEIPGYQLDQRLLEHPLAELWHGRTFTGMEIVALVLSEDGARDETVVERLTRASRDAALVPGQQETPLWAANFNSNRPYAITQLIPGQTGAERLVDPLDGIIGNDDASLQAIRRQLSGYGATAPTLPQADTIPSYVDRPHAQHQPPPNEPSKIDVARQYSRKIGSWMYAVVAVVVLIVFSITYSIGSAIGSAVKKHDPVEVAAPAVSPGAFPAKVLIPPVNIVTTAPYKRPDGSAGLFGATYATGSDLQVIANAELPFALGWPRPPQVIRLGESSQVILRKIVTASEYDPKNGLKNSFQAQLALHPCVSLAQCLADRPSFDQLWTKIYKTTAPTTAKDARTWLTVSAEAPYTITMTHAFLSGGQWWLIGAMVYGPVAEAPDVQRVVNDIWRQTS